MISSTGNNFKLPSLERDFHIPNTKTSQSDQSEDALIDAFLKKAISTAATMALILGASTLAYQSYNYGISSVFNNVSSFFKIENLPQNPTPNDPNLAESRPLSSLEKIGYLEIVSMVTIKILNMSPPTENFLWTTIKTNILTAAVYGTHYYLMP